MMYYVLVLCPFQHQGRVGVGNGLVVSISRKLTAFSNSNSNSNA
jgi:hypothetical protein